jgi:ribosome-associated protein
MKTRISKILEILDSKKGSNIKEFYFPEGSYFASAVVLCTSLNGRHANSLLDELKTLKPKEEFLNVDTKSDTWIIGDLGDIIIHILNENMRDEYKLDNFFNDIIMGKLPGNANIKSFVND